MLCANWHRYCIVVCKAKFGDKMPLPDITQRYVRVTRTGVNGFVEFDFIVSDEDLTVELILPEAAFDEFCTTNSVTVIRNLDVGSSPTKGQGLLQTVK
ncbi:phenol hydroxylase subunit [Caballeronia sp. M23-90]